MRRGPDGHQHAFHRRDTLPAVLCAVLLALAVPSGEAHGQGGNGGQAGGTAQPTLPLPGAPPPGAALPAPPVPVSAEPWFRAGTRMLTVQFGGTAFTDFQRGTARTAGDAELPDFRRRISARTTGSAGVWGAWWLTDAVALRGGAAYAPSGFAVWNEPAVERILEERGTEEGEYAPLSVILADAAVMFRLPRSLGRVVPYGLLGGGVVRYSAGKNQPLPPEARDRFEAGDWTGAAGLAGVGAAIPLQRANLLLTFELTSHFTRTPLAGHGEGESFELGGVPLRLDPDGGRADEGVGLTSAVRLLVGVTRPFR